MQCYLVLLILTGVYNDNAGSLTFTLYKLGCENTDTVYTCSGR